ncbi:MAG: BrnT family toxin [Thermodesulfobacteriota bacterium]
MQFEWDPAKARANLRKHGVPFREAFSIFWDPLGITFFDPDHSEEEERFITIGFSDSGRLLMVAHTDRGERICIISARELTHRELKEYEEEIKRRKDR